ncbi:MAG: hypothetical protein ACKOAR_01895 [Bacteroidota bacterium]
MTIAVTDACIFIDLFELNLLDKFLRCGLTIHTTDEVLKELFPHQQSILKDHLRSNVLHVHILDGESQLHLDAAIYPTGLSRPDRSVLFIASTIPRSIVLSGDRKVRSFAGKNGIACHGSIWIIDRLVERHDLTHLEGCVLLQDLLRTNLIYRNSKEMRSEVDIRIARWSLGPTP